MPRVIYGEKKIYGDPIETSILNIFNLHSIKK